MSIVVKGVEPNAVKIEGEIYDPGLVEFNKGKSIGNHHINSAGGITDLGNKNSIIVIYANRCC